MVDWWTRRLTLPHEGGQATVRALIVPGDYTEWQRSSASHSSDLKATEKYMVDSPGESVAALQWQRQQQHERQEHVFRVSAEVISLRQGPEVPSLHLSFSPTRAGNFFACLLFLPAESGLSQGTQGTASQELFKALGIVELHGIADAAALTLSDFCGSKMPISRLARMIPISLAACSPKLHKRLTMAAILQKATTTMPDLRSTLAVAMGIDETYLSRLFRETLLPNDIDFGFALVCLDENSAATAP